MSFFTTTGTITTPQQSGTNYYFVTFNNNGTITFNSSVSPISYLVVGGGGGGGAGYSFVPISGGGGGGASGDLKTGIFSPLLNQIINITVGAGGQGGNIMIIGPKGTGSGFNGNPSIIDTIITANGGEGAGPGNGQTISGLGGINSTYGNGGNGGQTGDSTRNPSNASGYPSGFSPYILNGFNVGNWGGGGGAGDLFSPSPNSTPQGQGGIGGTSNTSPTAGINGGGGGGGDYFNSPNGANGGQGVVILSFKQLTEYKIPGGNDLVDIFFPLSSGGTTGTTGTGYNYNTVSGYQDLKDLFAQYVPGSPTAPQTYYTTDYYGGKDLNLVFEPLTITYSLQYLIDNNYVIIELNNGHPYYQIKSFPPNFIQNQTVIINLKMGINPSYTVLNCNIPSYITLNITGTFFSPPNQPSYTYLGIQNTFTYTNNGIININAYGKLSDTFPHPLYPSNPSGGTLNNVGSIYLYPNGIINYTINGNQPINM